MSSTANTSAQNLAAQNMASMVVVGVDGGGSGRRALDFALREAIRRGSTVQVVTAWSWDGLDARQGETIPRRAARRQADLIQAEAVTAALTQLDAAPVVACALVEGNPAAVLARASRGAELLIVGSHGYGAVRRAILGSVAQECIQTATCPVVVVPAPHGSFPPAGPLSIVATL